MPIALAAAKKIGAAALSLAKKTIPDHTIVGKAIGSTYTGAGLDFSQYSTKPKAVATSPTPKASPSGSQAAQSLTNVAPSATIVATNLTGGQVAGEAGKSGTTGSMGIVGKTAESSSTTAPAKEPWPWYYYAGLGVAALFLLKKK